MKIEFKINNQLVSLEVTEQTKLVDIIRDRLGLKGTKENCRRGQCGMCTVILNGQAVRSCQIPAQKVDGAEIITIEGIGTHQKLHPLQQSFIDSGAVQCGFCEPAFIVAAYALLQKNPNPTREDIIKAINPILCRCTGYHQIIEAIEAVAQGKY